MTERLFSAYQVADLLGTSPANVLEWMQAGYIDAWRLPEGTIRFTEEAVCEFIRSRGDEFQNVLGSGVADLADSLSEEGSPADADATVQPAGRDDDRAMPSAPTADSEELADSDAPACDDGRDPAAEPGDCFQTVGAAEEDGLSDLERSALEWAHTEKPGRPAEGDDPGPAEADGRPGDDSLEAGLSAQQTPHTKTDDPPWDVDLNAASESKRRLAAEPGAWAPRGHSPTEAGVAEPRRTIHLQEAATDRDAMEIRPSGRSHSASAPAEAGPRTEAVRRHLGGLMRLAVAAEASCLHLRIRHDRLEVALRVAGAYEPCEQLGRLPGGVPVDGYLPEVKRLAGLDPRDPRPAEAELALEGAGPALWAQLVTCPCASGETAAIRFPQLVEGGAAGEILARLNPAAGDRRWLESLIHRSAGMILVAGPPRRGAGDLLWALAGEIAADGRRVLCMDRCTAPAATDADWVCYRPSAGLDFAAAARSALRLDADAAALADLPDQEAASAALEAARGGLLALAGLNAPSAAAALDRLLGLDLDPWPLSTSLIAVAAVRAVRSICPDCRQTVEPDPEALAALGLDASEIRFAAQRGAGCDACRKTGYYGKTMILSGLGIDADVAEAIRYAPTGAALHDAEWAAGLKTLRQAGLEAAMEGRTTLEELARVLASG